MNERIKELSEHCYHPYSEYNIDLEKFANLIINECAAVAFNHWCDGTNESSAEMEIKKHFGVN